MWYHDPAVTTPVLKLFAELVVNRSQRLQFDVSSPNGVLLFREASKVMISYGKYVKHQCVIINKYFLRNMLYYSNARNITKKFMQLLSY